MSPREIMNEQETNGTAFDPNTDRMPEIPSTPAEDEYVLRDDKTAKDIVDSKNDYANAFPDWDLLPPQVEIRRVSHRQG